MSVRFRIKDLGRGKWCGEVDAQSEQVEHIEHALMEVAKKHLRSRDIDFGGDTESGTFIAGFRTVGSYERIREASNATA